jgi:hypothetical protein
VKRLIQGVRGSTTRLVVVGVSVALITGATGAVAADLLTGKDIKNNSLGAKELKKKLRKKINKGSTAGTAGAAGQAGAAGAQGAQGPPGATGAQGSPGASGIASYENPEWGVIARNTIGSAVADLRGGPFGSFGVTGPQSEPPFGDGSLAIHVSDEALTGGDKREKAAFGNEVDFFGDPVSGINEAGYHVFQTGENTAPAGAAGDDNLPNLTFEIDPNLGGASAAVNYSSLVFLPNAQPFLGGGSWTGYIDATDPAEGGWYLTNGTAATQTTCALATPCTFDAMQTALADGGDAASIYTVQIVKGRDDSFVGAVDGLRLGDTVYDFEPFGVVETDATP